MFIRYVYLVVFLCSYYINIYMTSVPFNQTNGYIVCLLCVGYYVHDNIYILRIITCRAQKNSKFETECGRE